MSDTSRPALKQRFRLSEDWIATLIGLAIVLVIAAGAIGPGPQSAKLKAAAGENGMLDVPAADGWTISATLDGTAIDVDGATGDLRGGERYAFTCTGGALQAADSASIPADFAAPDGDHAQIVLVNGCDAAVSLAFKRDAAIRWPVFSLFD